MYQPTRHSNTFRVLLKSAELEEVEEEEDNLQEDGELQLKRRKTSKREGIASPMDVEVQGIVTLCVTMAGATQKEGPQASTEDGLQGHTCIPVPHNSNTTQLHTGCSYNTCIKALPL